MKNNKILLINVNEMIIKCIHKRMINFIDEKTKSANFVNKFFCEKIHNFVGNTKVFVRAFV